MRIHLTHAAFILSMLALPACGYHLRGAVDLPDELKHIYIEGAGAYLHQELKQSLRSADGDLVESPDLAGMIIRVVRDDMRRRVLALDNQGKAIEYELNYTVSFLLLDPKGRILLDRQDIEIDRDFFNSQQDILAKNNEELVIREEIYRQAVRSMFSRARAVFTN